MKHRGAGGPFKPGVRLEWGGFREVFWLVPSRLKRFHHSGQTHFITFGCYRRRTLFLSDDSTGYEGCVEIESEWTASRRERVAGELSPLVRLPTQAKSRLEWATPPSGRSSRMQPGSLRCREETSKSTQR